MENNQKAICPECDSEITLIKGVKVGDILECQICGAECEIIKEIPLELSPLEEEK